MRLVGPHFRIESFCRESNPSLLVQFVVNHRSHSDAPDLKDVLTSS